MPRIEFLDRGRGAGGKERFTDVADRPPPERIKLWQLLEKLKERDSVSQETQGPPSTVEEKSAPG